jgi:aspartyl-tRNA(Asn)/glutamyl-tRNA(Gln) amidotransferase subunit A
VNNDELCFASATEIARLVQEKELSAREVVETFLTRIDRVGPVLNCFTRVLADDALTQAMKVDEDVARGNPHGCLAGVPIGVKDLVDIAGVPTTHGGHSRFHTMPQHDAPIIHLLRREGAICIGKTALHEFAYGVTNNNPHFGPTRNPWDLSRIPGGSSGGSAAAVAAGLCTAAIGTDTGGSIRIPAALCGIVGIKPTYDRVSREGITPLAWSLDHVGPLTRSVTDAELLLHVLDGSMATGRPLPAQPAHAVMQLKIAGLRVGLPRVFWEAAGDDVRALGEGALQTLKSLGATVREVEFPSGAIATSAVSVIISAEATAVHEDRLHEHPEAYGADVRIRLDSGFFVRGIDYIHAQRVRGVILRECLNIFNEVDILALPTTTHAAPPIDESPAGGSGQATPVRVILTRLTNPFNLLGLPALSIPCGFTVEKLPVGLQLVGRPNDEATVFRLGGAYETKTEWTRRRPPLALSNA